MLLKVLGSESGVINLLKNSTRLLVCIVGKGNPLKIKVITGLI